MPFPKPYINDTGESRETDPMMKRVPVNVSDIGARMSGLPKDVKNSSSIEHVSGGASGSK